MQSAKVEPLFRRQFLLSGKATATFVSLKTGTRFTYRIELAPESTGLYFVSVLSGPDNTRDYVYAGSIAGPQQIFRSTKGSKVSAQAPSYRAFLWAWEHLDSERLEVWHAGACGRCGRELTDPESISRGLGPVCAGL